MSDTVRCPSGHRVTAAECVRAYVEGNAHASVAQTKARYLRCRKCGVGAVVRADFAAEGDRIGWSERGWMQELRDTALRGLLAPSGREQKYLDTAGKGR